jgi:hypothetical protein
MSGVKECTPNMQLREAALIVFVIIGGGQKKGVAFFSYWCVAFLSTGLLLLW